jgi:hypothetical protein
MAEPALTSVFGAGATQDATTLTISKSDLATVGLTAASINTAESLLAAIITLAANTLTATNQTLNADQHCSIQNANTAVYESPFGTRLRQNLLISFDDPFVNPGVTPDNY